MEPGNKIDPTKIYLALGLFIASGLFGIYELARGAARTSVELLLFCGVALGGIIGSSVLVMFGFKMKSGKK